MADSGPSIAVYGGGNSRPTVTFNPWQHRFVPYDTALFTPPRTDTVAATVTDAGGHATRFTVNAVGQTLTTTGVLNDTLRVTYNSALLADSIIPRWGPRSGYRYDGAGLDTLATVEGLHTHSMYRHGFAVADTVWGDATPTQRSAVGSHGEITSSAVALRPGMAFTYDSRGRVVTTSDPEAHQTFSWFAGTNGNRSRDSLPGGAFTCTTTTRSGG